MRVVKDTPLELGWITWQVRPPVTSLVCVVKATFSIVPEGPCPLAPVQAPVTGDLYWDDDPTRSVRYDSDLAIGKSCGEWWVTGTWRAEAGRSVRHHTIRVVVAGQEKRVALLGARHWTALGGLTEAAPFAEMPLAWELAFGGRELAENPFGLGTTADPLDAEGRVRLPSLEHPDRLIGGRGDRPPPTTLGPMPRTFASRAALTGTYDDAYMRTRWPYLPEDFRWDHFLAAPPDQRAAGFFRGDERLELEGALPSMPYVRCRLPAICPRAFLCADGAPPGSPLVDIPLVLDTLVIDLDLGAVQAVWRGFADGIDPGLRGLSHIFLVHEPLGQPAAPESYRVWFDGKLAEEDAEDADLAAVEPPRASEPPPPPAPDPEADAEVDPEALALAERIEQREQLRNEGMPQETIDRILPRDPPPKVPVDPAALAAAEKKADEAALAALAALGGPELVAMAEALRAPAEPEREPEPEAAPPPAETPRELRQLVIDALARRESLAGKMLAGADLSGLVLAGQDLRGAVLTGADLSRVDLRSAVLDGATLDRARLDDARLEGASLREAHVDGLYGERVSFAGALLEDAHGEGLVLVGANFTGAEASRAELLASHLGGACFDRARLDGADLTGSNLESASFIDASLVDAWFERVAGARACFEGADASLLRASGSDLRECNFKWAKLDGARFGRAWVDRSNFSFATLAGADFGEASLTEVVMLSVNAPEARFGDAAMVGAQLGRANLLRARLEGANLHHADLRGANLYGAELYRAQVEDARFELANLEGTKLEGR